MRALGAWLLIAANAGIVRRALLTSLVVGTILTLVNRGAEIVGGRLTPEVFGPILLTYVTPYIVATISGVAAIRSRRTAHRLEGET